MAFASSPLPSLSYRDQFKLNAPLLGAFEFVDFPVVQSKAMISLLHRWRAISVKPGNADLQAVSFSPALEVENNSLDGGIEDYEELARVIENASPLEIIDKALEKFGNDIAIAFSGAEDVALIEYARLTGRPFRVFSLDTGRLNPETYRFFDSVEKHYGIHIEYMFPLPLMCNNWQWKSHSPSWLRDWLELE